MAVVLDGFRDSLAIFHGSDETVYHLPTIARFAHELPVPDLRSYPAAQTPAYHYLLAVIGQIVGLTLWKLRLAQVVISYLLSLATYRLLHRTVGIERRTALVLAVLFTLSPYVFGQSYRLNTDNLALLLVVLCVGCLDEFRRTGTTRSFALAALTAGLAVLTRQSTGFLVLVAIGLSWVRRDIGMTQIVKHGVLLALAIAPALALFATWHGLVPVGSDPGSCGLCGSSGDRVQHAALFPASLELGLATIGGYGAVLLLGPRLRGLRRAIPALLTGIVLLVLLPARATGEDAGDLWRLAGELPAIGGTSLLFWLAVPAGILALWWALPRAPTEALGRWFTGAFLLSLLVTRFSWQKYVDPYILIALLLMFPTTIWRSPRARFGLAVLLALFIAYAADTGAHRGRAPAYASAPIHQPTTR